MHNDTLQGAQYLGMIHRGRTPTPYQRAAAAACSSVRGPGAVHQGRFFALTDPQRHARAHPASAATHRGEPLVLIEKSRKITPVIRLDAHVYRERSADFRDWSLPRGSRYALTPREVIRDFIEPLNILCQNSDANG